MLRVLLTLPQGPQLPGGACDRLNASIALAVSAITRSCDLLASTFLPAAVAGPAAMRDLPDLVQAELQRLLLSLKSRFSQLACPPDGDASAALSTRAGLGFAGRSFVSLQHNPLFPQSPTGRRSIDGSLRMSFGESSVSPEASLDVHATPEPYQCSAIVALPQPVSPLMCLVVYMVCEVCSMINPHSQPVTARVSLGACATGVLTTLTCMSSAELQGDISQHHVWLAW